MQGSSFWGNMEVTDVVPSDPDAKPGIGPQPVTYLLQNSVLTL